MCYVQVFGRRHDEAIHALRRPASEKRQCTKSREYGTRSAASAMGIVCWWRSRWGTRREQKGSSNVTKSTAQTRPFLSSYLQSNRSSTSNALGEY
jgi:hypothetical protein